LNHTVDIAANVKDIKREMDAAKENTIRRNIRDWLLPPDPSSSYRSANEKRQPGTGEWFLKSLEFERWKTTPNSFAWLYGLREYS
jgi:hypothetical protein